MFSSDKWFGATPSFYNGVITSSLRFDNGSDTYLYDVIDSTPSSTTQTTVSFWVKRASLGDHIIFCGYTSAPNVAHYINFNSADKLVIYLDKTAGGSDETNWNSGDMVFRDTTNWYHIAVQYDLGQSSNTDKVKVYVNGTQITLTVSQTGSAVTAHRLLDSGIRQRWGNYFNSGADLDGYLAEVNVIDGQVVSQNSFGETKNGVWVAKEYSGTYGNNGYRLQFKQTGDGQSTASASTIGADTSSNNHHFQDFNFDTHDSNMPDSPENNFATLNPLSKQSSSALSEGNLKAVLTSGGNSARTPSTFAVSSGKWYWEVRQSSSNRFAMGVFDADNYVMTNEDGGVDAYEWVLVTDDTSSAAQLVNNSNYTSGYGGTVADGHVVMVALDVDNGAIWFGKQGSWFNKGTSDNSATVKAQIEAGTTTNAAFTSVTGNLTPVFVRQTSNNTLTANFGADDTFHSGETSAGNSDANGNGSFQYLPPTDFLALCSANLPDTTISPNQSTQADDHFNTILWDGNSSFPRALTGVGFKPDWIWTKTRNQAYGHGLFDSSRGASAGALSSQNTNAEPYAPTNFDLDSFDSDGMTWASTADLSTSNNSGDNYVAWNWKANGSTTSSNGDGSKTSTVQANTTSGFSIVLYSGDTSSFTVGHGLDFAPEWVIVKSRTHTERWAVFHTSISNQYIYLNETFAGETSNADERFGNSTSVVVPSATVVTLGANNSDVSKNGENYVMYCFHSVEGFSRFGKYTGNNSTDGTFVYTGFKPAWVMIKAISQTESWGIHDNTRNTFNVVDNQILANVSNAENAVSSARQQLDFTSNGFKLKNSGDSDASINNESTTYIYMAFAEQPFKFSNAR